MSTRWVFFSHAVPVLPVDDMAKTIHFYAEKLGFEATFKWGDPPYYAAVKRDESAEIHFSEREDTTVEIVPCSVYVFVSDVDALHEELKSKGIPIYAPPEDQEYGMREFEIRDVNGHFLVFGERL